MVRSRPRTQRIQSGESPPIVARTFNKLEWEKLYRAAVLEPDRSKLAGRIERAEAAMLDRERRIVKLPATHQKECEAIRRALHILNLLRQVGPGL